MRIPRQSARLATLLLLLAAIFFSVSLPAAAEYLFDTARQFYFSGRELGRIAPADINNDGLNDLVCICEWYQGTDQYAILVRLGSGNGEFAQPVATLVESHYWGLHVTWFDDDPYPDLVINRSSQGWQFTTMMGNGDGTFTEGPTYTGSSGTIYTLETGDFNGDGVTDVAHPEGLSVKLHLGQGDGTFAPGPQGVIGWYVETSGQGDVDEDGDLDLVFGHYNSGDYHFTVLFNDGAGSFTQGPPITIPSRPVQLAVVDLSGDGHLDVLTGDDYPEERLSLREGNGDGTFPATAMIDIGESPGSWDLGDLDEDGDLDIVSNCDRDELRDAIAVVLNSGDGSFGEPKYCFGKGEQVSLSDMDGDGHLDAMMVVPGAEEYACVLLGRGDGGFRTADNVVLGEFPARVAVDDLDGDGDADVAVCVWPDLGPEGILVVLNDFPGGMGDPTRYAAGAYAWNLATGDLNGDGFNDILIVDRDEDRIFTILNEGDGTFQSQGEYVEGYSPMAAALGDLDGDGDLDVAVINEGAAQMSIRLNNGGTGWLAAPLYYDATRLATDIILADLDGDGDLDAAMDHNLGYGNDVIVIKNNGDGSFALPQSYEATDPRGIDAGDFDGDGDLDLCTGSTMGDYISILFNNGNGVFGGAVVHDADGGGGWQVAVDDVNLDGAPDLLIYGGFISSLLFAPGNGDGTFGSSTSFITGWPIPMLGLGDFDGDQDREVVTAYSDPGLHIVYNNAADFVPTGLLVTGPGPGEFNPTLVRVYGVAAGRSYTEWSAYGVDRWGVNVALGELDGTAGPEVLTGAGPGAVFGPHVRGFQDDGTPLPGVSFLAYGTNKFGVNVCSGDLDGDGYDEIVTGAGPGAVFGPHVRGWNWDGTGTPTPIPGISYFAYGTPKWGVNVSCGDIDGDGYDEIVTGAGPGAVYGPHVRGWNCDGGGASSIPGVSFFAYGTLKFGVNVACGDIDGDGIDEMVTGAGPGAVFGPHVRAFNWDGTGSAQSIPGVSWFAYDYTQWGANVSCGDLDNDGIDEILTGPGPGESHAPRVRGWNYDGQTLTALGGVDFYAYGSTEVTHGVKVGGLRH